MMRRGWPLAIACVLLAVVLASRWLNYDLLFVDEWWSIFKSGGDIYGPLSPAGVWDRIVTIDPGGMGAGYYITLGLWQALVGSTPFAVRAYSLLFGAVAIAMTYRVGASWFSPQVGAIAAALLATSAFFLNFMHEARAYTLVAALACWAIYRYWRVVSTARPRWTHYAALTLALAALAYSHYVALSVAAVIAVYHVLWVAKDRRWLLVLGSMLASAVLYLPWVGVMLDVVRRGADDANRQSMSMPASAAVGELAEAFSNGNPAFLLLLLAAALLLYRTISIKIARVAPSRAAIAQPTTALAKTVGAVSIRPPRRVSAEAMLWSWLVVGLTAALVVNAAVPFLVHLRYLMFLWPALALIGALGVVALARRSVPAVLVLGVWAIIGIGASMTPSFMRAQFGEVYRAPSAGVYDAVAVLDGLSAEGDLVLYHIMQPGFEPFGLFIEDYLSRSLPGTVTHAQTEFMNNAHGPRSDAEYRADIEAVLNGQERVWVLDVPEIEKTQRTGTLADRLAEQYADCGAVVQRSDATLRLYTLLPDLPAFRADPPHAFGSVDTGFARLRVITAPADTRRPADAAPLNVTLGWQGSNRLRGGTHSVAVHVVDADGAVVAQDDYPLPTAGYGCKLSMFSPALPAGDYQLYATVYDWRTLEPLPVDGATDGRLLIHSLHIER